MSAHKKNIDSKIDQIRGERDGGWKNFRDKGRFKSGEVTLYISDHDGNQYPHVRKVWAPVNEALQAQHAIELQESRGVVGQDSSTYNQLEDYLDRWDEKMAISNIETVRIWELEHTLSIITDPEGKENGIFCIPDWEPTGYCDIGFKYPRLLKHYGDKYGCKTLGIDVNDLSIELARYHGYDSRRVDLMHDEEYGLGDYNLITINHVLEHVSYPHLIIQKLFDELPDGALVQAEVPIEYDQPNLDFGHMFGFHPGDLLKFFTSLGFLGLSQTTTNIGHAYNIERIHAVKVDNKRQYK